MNIKRTIAIALMALTLPLTACGGKDTTQTKIPAIESCADWQGNNVSATQWSNACAVGNKIMATTHYDCKDGRKLYWNDWGWGYADGKAQAHVPTEGQQLGVPPKAELTACK